MIKGSLREFWRKHFCRGPLVISRVPFLTPSGLEPEVEKTSLFEKYRRQILTSFWYRINNPIWAGHNSKIETVRKTADGFRDEEPFKKRSLYSLE